MSDGICPICGYSMLAFQKNYRHKCPKKVIDRIEREREKEGEAEYGYCIECGEPLTRAPYSFGSMRCDECMR